MYGLSFSHAAFVCTCTSPGYSRTLNTSDHSLTALYDRQCCTARYLSCVDSVTIFHLVFMYTGRSNAAKYYITGRLYQAVKSLKLSESTEWKRHALLSLLNIVPTCFPTSTCFAAGAGVPQSKVHDQQRSIRLVRQALVFSIDTYLRGQWAS